jgi:hypothetical protein
VCKWFTGIFHVLESMGLIFLSLSLTLSTYAYSESEIEIERGGEMEDKEQQR